MARIRTVEPQPEHDASSRVRMVETTSFAALQILHLNFTLWSGFSVFILMVPLNMACEKAKLQKLKIYANTTQI
jgi:hypothetical protein